MYKTLLVHVDASDQSLVRLPLAQTLAARHEGHLTAVFASTPAMDTSPFVRADGSALRRLQPAADGDWRTQAKARLEAAMLEGPDVGWRELPIEALARSFVSEALCADLVVLGQPLRGRDVPGEAPVGFAEAVITDSGRPTLVVPREHPVSEVGRRVLVAWNATPRCARALAAALPILRQAGEVEVVTWADPAAPRPAPTVDVIEALQRHGIHAQREVRGGTLHVGEAIVRRAADRRADLVVMGFEARLRERDRILGGATRAALATSGVPLLVAH